MSKRRRTTGNIVRAARRPIDKEIKVVLQTATSAAQTSTTLKTTTFPCTVVGIRWNVSILQQVTTADSRVVWAIVVIPDGQSASTMAISNAADFYQPEQNVITWGIATLRDSDVGSGPSIIRVEGFTKTMRKLAGGDVLAFIGLSSVVDSSQIFAVVQFFCKS